MKRAGVSSRQPVRAAQLAEAECRKSTARWISGLQRCFAAASTLNAGTGRVGTSSGDTGKQKQIGK